MGTADIAQITGAALNAGITRIHWTGGEPTLRGDILNILRDTQQQGYIEQVMTTNGTVLHSIIHAAARAGLSRVNISLDTLSQQRFTNITTKDALQDVLQSIGLAVEILPGVTKINAVVMRRNLIDIPELLEYCEVIHRHRHGKIALKLIAISPNNPAMLTIGGQRMYAAEHVKEDEILELVRQAGHIERVESGNVKGDNPNCEYYITRSGLKVGVLAMPSWGFRCAGSNCRKLRVTPFGEAKACLEDGPVTLLGRSAIEQAAIFRSLMRVKEKEDEDQKKRMHYSAELGAVRFGHLGRPVPRSVFDQIDEDD